jgi:predicted TIM-barrel fold metal-dependent hydrolase
MMEAPIVDAHAHIFTRDMPLANSAWFRPEYEFTAEQYLATLDAHGIHFGVIAGISIYGTYNDYMLEQLRKHKRLRGTANVAPTTDRYILERMKADGVVGVRLQLTRRKELPNLQSEEYQLLLKRLVDLDMHVQVIVEGASWPLVLPQLEASGVKIVIDHFGHPTHELGASCPGFQAMLRSVEKGRTWVKLSAAFRLTWSQTGLPARDPQTLTLGRQLADSLIRNAGPERLVWGSDCPFVGYERAVSYQDTLDELGTWATDAQTRRRLSDTALKLYFS